MKSKNTCDYLTVDCSNLLYRTFYANKSEEDITIAGMAMHMALTTLNKYYKQFKPRKNLILTFDRPNWRKEYTKTDKCISKKLYKGNRRNKMTPAEKKKYATFLTHLGEFEDMMRNHASAVVLAADQLEADDLMAGVVQIYSMDPTIEIVVVSGDGDMKQLLKFDNVRLINPATGKDQNLDEWNGDVGLFMFEKCIRGDRGDDVQSAYPRVKTTKILRAYEDPLAMTNMMHETWQHPDGREMMVKRLYAENKLLMDLECQPDNIQQLIIKTVIEGMSNPGKFSYFHFMQFLGKYELKTIAKQVELFAPMLNC